MRPLKKIQFLAGYWLIWIGLFELARAFFIFYNHTYRGEAKTSDLLMSFFNGWQMDVSAASYIILPCCLMMSAAVFFRSSISRSFFHIYSLILLLPVLLIVVCDLPAFGAWGYRLDATPLKYLSHPGEARASVSHLPLWQLLTGMILGYYLSYRLFSWYIKKFSYLLEMEAKPIFTSFILLLLSGSLIIPIRGGLQLAPLNQSGVYKSRHHFVNISSLNAVWNFMYSLSFGIQDNSNPFAYLPSPEADSIKNKLYDEKGAPFFFLDSSVKQPNIILITWESFTAKSLGLDRSGTRVVPGFESLIPDGLFFDKVYATGDRTEKGILGILSGYPALPTVNMMRMPEQHSRLSTIPAVLSARGYNTSFYYGGEIEFANMKTFLLKAGFGKITDKNDFGEKEMNSKWGAHDHVVSERIKKELDTAKVPFFINWLTLSSHEPFETGLPPSIPGGDDVSKFLNSLHYTDSVIHDFVQYCRSRPWWNNTLLIIIADHGHKMPYTGRKIDDFRIPMLWTGGAVSKKGMTFSRLMNQTDLAATLTGQLNIPADFPWSRNMGIDSVPQWAYFSFKNGFGWLEPDGHLVFDNTGRSIIESGGRINESTLKKGKSIQQLSYDDFLGAGIK